MGVTSPLSAPAVGLNVLLGLLVLVGITMTLSRVKTVVVDAHPRGTSVGL